MAEYFVDADSAVLDLLRHRKSMTVLELAAELNVTSTAVRQRLNRLLGQQHIERTCTKQGRGRPSHNYRLTEKGRRKAGSNFTDLATALWQEVRAIRDPGVRQGLLQRLAGRLAVMYADKIKGRTLRERLQSVVEFFSERQIPLVADYSGAVPVLTAASCPYSDLANEDRGVCAMERLMFSQMLQERVRLSACRLDGQPHCTFHCNQ